MTLEEKHKAFDIKKLYLQKKKLAHYPLPLPHFDIGADFLGDSKPKKKISKRDLQQYADRWFRKPEKYLLPNRKSYPLVEEKDGFLVFQSLLDNSQLTRFKYNPQPEGTPGRKVALIHLMHWNGRLKPYDWIISFIRSSALPISTLIHVPAGRGLNPGEDSPADYESVSPNIGKTIFRTRQDIQDIQFMARYLKEKMGYEEVGLFTYSIGSSRGIIAPMIAPGLFDFCIFHMVADDFTEALMKGIATIDVADEINGKIDYQLLQKLWSTISPGSYSGHFSSLPKNTRIVQCEYDFVFGLENVKKFSDRIVGLRPDINLEVVPQSHLGLGNFPVGLKVMWNNIRYIYNHTRMRECKRSRLFR